MTANQTGQVVEPEPETESREARREEDPRSILSKEELTGLQEQRDELSSQLALAQQAAAEARQHSTASEVRLREMTEELDRAKTGLEQQAAERARLESELGEQLTAAKAATEEAEAVCREEAQRSKGFEAQLCNLQKEREELSSKLAATQQAAGESKRQSEDQENQLREGKEQLEQAKTWLEQQAAERAR